MSSTIHFKSDFKVDLVDYVGSDELICKAARVSTMGSASIDSEESAGLIKFLMKNRHGSPFEHASMIFRIHAPIFVWREFMRHRIGVSYNEESGRYKTLDPVFYIPSGSRPIIQVGKPGEYSYQSGSDTQHVDLFDVLFNSYDIAWKSYQELLLAGVAKEVARMCLPVSIFSTAYVTMNPRSLMHFLSLRTKSEDSTFPSFPMWEINQVALMIEHLFKECFPLTYDAFNKHGRVSP